MHDAEILIPLTAIALPMVIVPAVLIFRHAAKKREYQHAERMRALDMGQPVPGEDRWPAAFVCAAIGAGVPVGSFLFTFLATVNGTNVPAEIWIAPALVSAAALLTSMGMAGLMFAPRQKTSRKTETLHSKPQFDPDSYDVVGSRG